MGDQAQLDRDVAHAWSSARNLQLRDAMPGPREVHLGGDPERRTIDRREALVGSYARLVLVHCRADPDRLSAIEPACRAQSLCSRTDRRGARQADTYEVGAEIAAEALRIVCEAGAVTDQRARAKLLAGAEYQCNREFFGDLDDNQLAGSPADFIAELERIDATEDEDLCR